MAAETKKKEEEAAAVEEETAATEKPKRKPAGKAPAKPLPQMMEEDVIPSLKSTLQAQDDITELELSFNDNKVRLIFYHTNPFAPYFYLPSLAMNFYCLFQLEGSFLKKGYPYSFWAFFPNGLTGISNIFICSLLAYLHEQERNLMLLIW